MKIPYLSSFGARRTKHGFVHRTTWAMWAVAVLVAVVVVPVQRTAWADPPDDHDQHNASVTIAVDQDSIEYETATATITVTGAHTLFDKSENHDANHTENWHVSYITKVKATGESIAQAREGGPGVADGDFEFTATGTQGEYTATVELETYYDPDKPINSLWPGQTHVVEATLSYDSPKNRDVETATNEFDTKGECVTHDDAATIRDWHGTNPFIFQRVTRTTIILKVEVGYTFAPVNSGRCLTYDVDGGVTDARRHAYVYNDGSGGRQAWIIETGLMPGTYYDFGVHPDPKFSGGSSGTGTYTLGPRLIIEVEDIEQTEATVNVALPTDEFEDMGERTIHLAYYETADEHDLNLRNIQVKPTPQVTVKGSTSFGLDNLSAGTKYKVKASLASAFPTHHTEAKTFTTKLGKPTDLEVEPGDRQLEVSWKAPDGDGVGITGYEVEYREDGEQSWATSSASVEESTDPLTDAITYSTTISSLEISTLYNVRVRAVNSVIEDDKDDYNWAERSGTTLPDLPASLEVTPGIKQLTLAWEEPAGTGTVDITRYVVQYKKTSDTSWTSHTTVAAVSGATTYGTTIPNLDISTEYDVRVRADNGVALQDDDDFNWTEGNGTTLPDVPASLEVTPGIKQLTLSWDEPAETGTVAITGYVVEYKEEAAPVWDTLPTVAAVSGTTTYETIIISLTDNTKYEVRVRADNGVTLQEQDNYNWADDTGTTLPGAPENLEVTPGNEKLTLRWEEPAETGNVNITGYKVQYKDSSVADWDSPTGVTEVSVSGLTREITSLTNNTTYDVRVRADNGVTSDNYNWVTGSDTPVPNPRIGIITVKTKSQIGATLTVTIEDFDFDKEQTVHLRHRVKSPPGTWQYATPQITGAGSVDFDLVSLSGNTVYEVEAWLAADTNDIAEYELTTSSVVPDPPTITDIEHGDRNLTVTWTKPGDGGSPITGYKIQWTVKGQNSWTSKTVNDPNALEGSTDQVLTNGTEYTVQVIAVNSVGDSQPSNPMHDTPSRKPYAPTIQSVTPGPKQLVVTWSEPANGGDPITNYKVEYKEQVAPSWTLHKEVDQNTFTETIGSLTNGTTYAVQVSAKNINGYGDPSPERTDTPRPEPAVSGVSVDEIEQTTAVATVNISDPTGEQKMVHLRFRVNSSSEARTTPTPQSTTTNSVAFPQFTGLKSDTEYRVEASFDSTFNSGVQFKLFTTKRPTVSSVEIDDNTITQAGATATVTIQEPNGKQQTVRLRYRPSTQDDWSTTATDAGEIPVNTSTDAAAVPISDLKSGTLYEVEASLESDYSQSATTTFTTEGPSLTGITISEVMQ